MNIRQSFEQISTASCDDQVAAFCKRVTLSGHGNTKTAFPSVELPNVDSADSNAVLPQVRARTSPGVFHDMALLGLCLELAFSVLYCRTQANLPALNVVLLWQNLDVCLIWNLKHVWASPLASDLGKTNAFAMLIGSRESKTFFTAKKGHVPGKV